MKTKFKNAFINMQVNGDDAGGTPIGMFEGKLTWLDGCYGLLDFAHQHQDVKRWEGDVAEEKAGDLAEIAERAILAAVKEGKQSGTVEARVGFVVTWQLVTESLSRTAALKAIAARYPTKPEGWAHEQLSRVERNADGAALAQLLIAEFGFTAQEIKTITDKAN